MNTTTDCINSQIREALQSIALNLAKIGSEIHDKEFSLTGFGVFLALIILLAAICICLPLGYMEKQLVETNIIVNRIATTLEMAYPVRNSINVPVSTQI